MNELADHMSFTLKALLIFLWMKHSHTSIPDPAPFAGPVVFTFPPLLCLLSSEKGAEVKRRISVLQEDRSPVFCLAHTNSHEALQPWNLPHSTASPSSSSHITIGNADAEAAAFQISLAYQWLLGSHQSSLKNTTFQAWKCVQLTHTQA